jgi:hypothetical protein
MGEDAIVESIMLRVRGGDEAVGLVADLRTALGRRAIDLGSGDFFDESEAGESLAASRAYRDRVTGST